MKKQIYIVVGDGAYRDRHGFLTLDEAIQFKENNTRCDIRYEIRILDDRRTVYPNDKRQSTRRKQ